MQRSTVKDILNEMIDHDNWSSRSIKKCSQLLLKCYYVNITGEFRKKVYGINLIRNIIPKSRLSSNYK